jgi:hypothetical protein
MPNNYNFDGIRDLRTVEVNPQGWISPLFVEYGSDLYGGIPSYFWRVKGTQHTFLIPILRMDFISKGEYVKHFNEILEAFREDYIGWSKEGWYAEWMQQYREDYRSFITL